MEEPMTKSILPKTDSIDELARFWARHDLTDFESELEEVTEPVFVRHCAIEVQLEKCDAATIKELAQAKGISQEELVRGWVLQRLTRRNGSSSKKRHPGGKARR
jgi:hypothetical protein